MIKTILGFSLILLSIVLGLYLGLWVMFVGGIIQVIQSCTPIVNALGIELGLLRITFSSLVGWISFYILLGSGLALLK